MLVLPTLSEAPPRALVEARAFGCGQTLGAFAMAILDEVNLAYEPRASD
jgi:hypothetical protein